MSELYDEAANSQDAATLQTLKTMDSIETKLNQFKTTLQEFYTSSGIEELIKGVLDYGTSILNTFNNMPKLFDSIPVYALTVLARLITGVKSFSLNILNLINNMAEKIGKTIAEGIKEGSKEAYDAGAKVANEANKGAEDALKNGNASQSNSDKTSKTTYKGLATALNIASYIGVAMSAIGLSIDENNRKLKATVTTTGSILTNLSSIAGIGLKIGGLKGAGIGAVVGLLMSIPDILAGIETATEDITEKIKRFNSEIEDASNETLVSKNELMTLEEYKEKLEEATERQYDSAEAKQEYLDLNNEIAEKYPQLIEYITAEGDAIVSLGGSYETLLALKRAAYEEDLITEGQAMIAAYSDRDFLTEESGFGRALGGERGENNYWLEEGEIALSWSNYVLSHLGELKLGEIDTSIIASTMEDILLASFSSVWEEADHQFFANPINFANQMFRDFGILNQDESLYTKYINSLFTDSAQSYSGGVRYAQSEDAWEHIAGLEGWLDARELHPAGRFDITIPGIARNNMSFTEVDQQVTQDFYNALITALTAANGQFEKNANGMYELALEIHAIDLDMSDGSILTQETSTLMIEVPEKFINFYSSLETYISEQNDIYNRVVEGYVTKLFDSRLAGANFEAPSTLAAEIMQADFFSSYTEDIQTSAYAYLDSGEAWKRWSEGSDSFLALGEATSLISGANADLVASLSGYYDNFGTYTAMEIEEAKQEVLSGLDPDSELAFFINQAFENLLTPFTLIQDSAVISAENKQEEEFANQVEQLFTSIPYSFYSAFNEQLASYYELIKKTEGTENATQAQESLNEYITLLNSLGSLNLDQNTLNQAQNLIFSADLFSLSGLFELQEKLAEIGIDPSLIDGLLENSIINLNTEIESYISSVTGQLEEFSSAMSNLSSGLDIGEALEVSQRLGINVDKLFHRQGETFFLNDEYLQTYIDSYFKDYQDYYDAIDKYLSDENFSFVNNSGSGISYEQAIQELRAAGEDVSAYHLDDAGNLISGNHEALLAAYRDYWQSVIDGTQTMSEDFANYLKFQNQIGSGNLTGLLDSVDVDSEKIEAVSWEIWGAARSGEQALREYLVAEGIKLEEEYFQFIMDAVGSSSNDIISAFATAKIGAQIDAAAIARDAGDLAFAAELEGITFINTYDGFMEMLVASLNLTGEAYNAAVEEWVNAHTIDYQSIFENILSQARDSNLDISTVTELANALGMEIWQLVDLDLLKDLGGGKFQANLTALQTYLGDKIQYGEELINDHFQEYIEEILGYISGGISGSMSGVEFAKLEEYMRGIDHDINLEFTHTAEGLKLTQNSVLAVYSALSDANDLAAQVVLDELTKSAMESDESLNNVYNVMNDIVELNRQIAEVGDDTKREKQLRAELALAENIRDTLMDAGNAFNFMEQDLPTGATNPLSAWEGAGSAMDVLNGEDFANGYMGVQDFTNIMNFAAEELINSSADFQAAGYTASDLIRAGYNAIKIIDGEAVVDWSELAVQFQFSGDELASAVTDSIHNLAESQIEIIDAEIAVLETVVATQEAFDSLEGENGDGKIDLQDLLNIFKPDGTGTPTKEQQEAFDKAIEYVDEVKIKGIALKDILTNANGEWVKIGEDGQILVANILQGLNEIFNSDDILKGNVGDVQRLEDAINAMLAQYGYAIDLDGTAITKTIDFSGISTEEDIENKLIEVLGQDNWDSLPEEIRSNLVRKVQEVLEKNEEINLADLLFDKSLFTGDGAEAIRQQLLTALLGDYGTVIQLPPIGVAPDYKVEDGKETWTTSDGEIFNSKDAAIKHQFELDEQSAEEFLISQGVEAELDVKSGKIKYGDGLYDTWQDAYEAWKKDKGISGNNSASDAKTYGTTADIQVTPANITVQTTGESGELVASTPLEAVKATANSIIVTPAEGAAVEIQNVDGTNIIKLPSAEALAETLNLTSASNITYGTSEEGSATVEVTNVLDGTGTLGNLTLTRNADGTYSTSWSNPPTEVAIDGTIAATGEMSQFTASFTAETIRTTDATGEVLVDVSSVTFTASGLGEDGTQLVDVPITVNATPQTTYEEIKNQVISGLTAQGFSSATAETAATAMVNAYIGIEEAPANQLTTLEELKGYTQENPLKSWFKVNQEGSDEVTSALQAIIDSYNNQEINLNVNIRVGDEDPILNKYGLNTNGISSAAQTIEAGAQPETGIGFQSGIYAHGNGSKAWGPKWVATTNPMYRETGWSKRGNQSVMTSTEDNINSYLSAVQSKISAGELITPEDVQVLTDLQTIANGFDGASSLAWFDSLGQTMAMLETSPLAGDGLVATLTALSGMQLNTIVQAITDLTTNSTSLSTLSFDSLISFFTTLENLVGSSGTISSGIQGIKDALTGLTAQPYQIDLNYNISSQSSEQEGTYNVNIEDNGTAETLTTLATALANVRTQADLLATSSNAITETGPSNVSSLKDSMNNIPSSAGNVDNASKAIDTLATKINKIPTGEKTLTLKVTVTASGDGKGDAKGTYKILKTGNVALAGGSGSALAKGKTLMGELGPELVVSGGRYFTVGNNGAEFVDLPKDAIVFNHLQTKKLLGSGKGMVGTGEPVTNEKNATSLATGNVSGPAMASAAEALAQLKQIRAMWEGLLTASAQDLGKKAGSGGGGGGGGRGGGGSAEELTAYIHDLERWYNLLRQIEKWEQKITYEQAKRQNLQSGYDYSKSLQEELKILQKQQKAYKELASLQRDYYDERRKDLLSTDYAKIFTYDEDGLMQYVDGKGRGLDILATLNETDANGKAKLNSQQQINYLKNLGFDTSLFRIKGDGTKLESNDYNGMMEVFWAGVDGWMDELDSLYNEVNEHLTNIEENQAAQQEILNEYIENRLSIEEKLLTAITDAAQANIDKLQDNLDALTEASENYIQGLSDALNKEQQMYQENQNDIETQKLQRQLAILQRSGGSASEIKSLQEQLDTRMQDDYFRQQQEQINKLQEASDLQNEKLQQQIDIATETLEYQKENGLLWQEVYTMMNEWTPEKMLDFIEKYTASYGENSPLQNEEDSKETLKELEIWVDERDQNLLDTEWEKYYSNITFSDEIKKEYADQAQKAFYETYRANGGSTSANNISLAQTAANKVFSAGQAQLDEKNNSSIPQEPETPETSTPSLVNPIQFIAGTSQYWTYDKSSKGNKGQIFHGNGASPVVELLDAKNSRYKIRGYDGDGHYFNGVWISKKSSKGADLWKQYAEGGLVDYTGPAWVDGTKKKPEAFLSADDTALLKSKIFSDSDYSLRSVVESIQQLSNSFATITNSSISEGVVIENVTIEMQSGVIASDYDARRAGELALEEMVKIARRSTNLNAIRR